MRFVGTQWPTPLYSAAGGHFVAAANAERPVSAAILTKPIVRDNPGPKLLWDKWPIWKKVVRHFLLKVGQNCPIYWQSWDTDLKHLGMNDEAFGVFNWICVEYFNTCMFLSFYIIFFVQALTCCWVRCWIAYNIFDVFCFWKSYDCIKFERTQANVDDYAEIFSS